MREILYVDVLVCSNVFITWLLLSGGGLLAAVEAKPWRLLLGSLLGGAGSLLLFLPAHAWGLQVLEKLLLSGGIVWATFGYGGARRFLRCMASFFAANFAFAGLMLALWLGLHPQGMFYQNGAVYFDVSLPVFLVFACVCYAALRGLSLVLRRRHPGANLCAATVHVGGQSITLPALYDSGNRLTDGFTGRPVAVGEFAALAPFLPPELHAFFAQSQSFTDVPATHAWRARLREVPFHALGQNGLLPAFKTDQVVVQTKALRQSTAQAFVAVTTESLSDGSYHLLLQADMLEPHRSYQSKKRGPLHGMASKN